MACYEGPNQPYASPAGHNQVGGRLLQLAATWDAGMHVGLHKPLRVRVLEAHWRRKLELLWEGNFSPWLDQVVYACICWPFEKQICMQGWNSSGSPNDATCCIILQVAKKMCMQTRTHKNVNAEKRVGQPHNDANRPMQPNG